MTSPRKQWVAVNLMCYWGFPETSNKSLEVLCRTWKHDNRKLPKKRMVFQLPHLVLPLPAACFLSCKPALREQGSSSSAALPTSVTRPCGSDLRLLENSTSLRALTWPSHRAVILPCRSRRPTRIVMIATLPRGARAGGRLPTSSSSSTCPQRELGSHETFPSSHSGMLL